MRITQPITFDEFKGLQETDPLRALEAFNNGLVVMDEIPDLGSGTPTGPDWTPVAQPDGSWTWSPPEETAPAPSPTPTLTPTPAPAPASAITTVTPSPVTTNNQLLPGPDGSYTYQGWTVPQGYIGLPLGQADQSLSFTHSLWSMPDTTIDILISNGSISGAQGAFIKANRNLGPLAAEDGDGGDGGGEPGEPAPTQPQTIGDLLAEYLEANPTLVLNSIQNNFRAAGLPTHFLQWFGRNQDAFWNRYLGELGSIAQAHPDATIEKSEDGMIIRVIDPDGTVVTWPSFVGWMNGINIRQAFFAAASPRREGTQTTRFASVVSQNQGV